MRITKGPPDPRRLAASVVLAALLGGCASGPAPHRPGGAPSAADRDGPEARPPPDLARVPDAEPRVEPIRLGGPNKPYDVLGRSYVPITQDAPFAERGLASWYGRKFNGKRTSSGELYDMYGMTAAHPTLPIPSYARIRNPANGREVVVRINDRGPFHSSRIVDLSYTAALKLDLLRGVAPVELQRITFDDIRTGAWRHGDADPGTALAAAAPAVPGGQDPVATPAPTSVASVPRNVAPAGTSPAPLGSAAVTPSANPAPYAIGPRDAAPAPTVAVANASPSGDAGVAAPLPAAAAEPPPPTATPVADAPAGRALTSAGRGYWVQLGAFRAHGGAESFLRRVSADMEWLSPLLAIFSESSMYRLQAGPYPSRDEARSVAERVRDGLNLVPVVVERR